MQIDYNYPIHFFILRSAIKSNDSPLTEQLTAQVGQQHSDQTIDSLKDISAIIVSYNSTAVLSTMLASIPEPMPIVIVDNGSTDDIDRLASEYQATLLKNNRNLGFGTASNQGAALAKTTYLMFLNPDTQIQGNAIPTLLSALNDHKKVIAVSPKVTDASGRQHFRHNSLLFPASANKLIYSKPTENQLVPLLSGPAFLITKSIFDQIGGFDEKIFLYHEDDDLFVRLGKLGGLMYIHNAEVMHLQGQSSARTPENAALKAYFMGQSRVYVLRKHNRPYPFFRSVVMALLELLSPVLLFSKRKRAKGVAFLKGIWSVK